MRFPSVPLFFSCWLAGFVLWMGTSHEAHSQTAGMGRVIGTIIDAQTKEPLGFATIYISQTTYGTNSAENGIFKLPVLPAGNHELVVSFLGYETLTYPFTLKPNEQVQFRFELMPKTNALQEVVVKPDTNWRYNYGVFLKNFIGQTANAAQIKILNPEVLYFVYDLPANVLTAEASEPIILINKALGYLLYFELKAFEVDFKNNRVFHAGYPRFEEMKPRGKAQQRRWASARLTAYNGSLLHFIRTLQTQTLEQEGFNVRRLQRLPNPHRPSEAEVQRGLKAWRGQSNTIVVSKNGVKDDSLQYWLQMARLPKQVEYLHKDPVLYAQMVQVDSASRMYRLQFPDFLNVVYIHEKEDVNFLRQNAFGKPRSPSFQTSVLFLTAPYAVVDRSGMVVDPHTHMVEGYWAWEKMAEMLPLDYQPSK